MPSPNMNSPNLEALGWDAWLRARRGAGATGRGVARVAAVDRDQLLLLDEVGAFRGKLSGRFLHEAVGACGAAVRRRLGLGREGAG